MTRLISLTLILAAIGAGMMVAWDRGGSSMASAEAADSGGSALHEAERHSGAPAGTAGPGEPPRYSAGGYRSSATAVATAPAARGPEARTVRRSRAALADDGLANRPSISGTVRDDQGFPLANIEILAAPTPASGHDGREESMGDAFEQSAWSDFDGSFVLAGLAEDEYRIRAAPLERFSEAETTARAGSTSADLVLERLHEVRVAGIVRTPDGQPLEGVRIMAGPPTRVSESGPKGRYQLVVSVRESESRQSVHFRRDGYRDNLQSLGPSELEGRPSDILLDVTMQPLKASASVTGRLRDADGNPVSGTLVNLKSASRMVRYRAFSDERGYFTMEGVEPGRDYQLSVRPGSDYKDYQRTLAIPERGLDLDVALDPLGSGEMTGWMIDAEGRPVPGLALTVLSQAAAGVSAHVIGDERGFFRVEEFPEGEVVLKTRSYPVFETHGARSVPDREEPIPVIIDLGTHALTGRVTSARGEAVAAAEVSLGWAQSVGGLQYYSSRRMAADADGHFAFAGLGPGMHVLRVSAPGFITAVAELDWNAYGEPIAVQLDDAR